MHVYIRFFVYVEYGGPARDCLEVTVGGPARRNAEQSR